MKNRKSITMTIPGGWYGNDPGCIQNDERFGVVSIDPTEIESALTWLKRRANIIKTFIDNQEAIAIQYRLRH